MTFQPGAAAYSQGYGTVPSGLNYPVYVASAPTSATVNGPSGVYQVGQMLVQPGVGIWHLLQLTSTGGSLSATWVQVANSTGDILAVAGTANQITSTTSAGTATLSLPAAITAPGSLTTTTTLSSGTTITAGTGITSTTGNLTLSAAASGFVLVPTVASGAASGTVAANGRVVSVTFTGVSIASGATQAFTTSNTSITGSGTVLALTWSGATAGSALSVVSIANTASQSVITMTNGTSATMVTSIANITFTYLVLN